MRYFETMFMEEANEFIAELDPKTIKKKVDKVPANEINRAERLREKYFQNKRKN